MDFELGEQQQMLRDSARSFLAGQCDMSVVRKLEASDAGHSPELWRKMAELGWTGLVVPAEHGGAGGSLLDLAVLFEEIGRAAFDSPLFATTLATLVLLEGASDAQRRELLPAIASGERIATLALAEAGVSNDPRFVATQARLDGGQWVLRGTKLFVPYAAVADRILVVARSSGVPGDAAGIGIFVVDGRDARLRCSPMATIAPDKQYRIDLDDLRVPSAALIGGASQGLAFLEPALAEAAAIQCAEMLGGAEHELETTAAYTRERVQFDRPLGTFQAVQHHLADMFSDVQGTRWTTYQAVYRLAAGVAAARELAIACAFTCDAGQRIAFGAQQLHGGAGVDVSNDLHFYYRRAKALELALGAAPRQLEVLEGLIGLDTPPGERQRA